MILTVCFHVSVILARAISADVTVYTMSARWRKRNQAKARMSFARAKLAKKDSDMSSQPDPPGDSGSSTGDVLEKGPERLTESDVYAIAKNWVRDPERSREDVQMICTLLFCYHRQVRPRARVMEAAAYVGEVTGKGEKTVRDWVNELRDNDGEFLEYGRGKYKRISFLTDERCRELATKWVRENSCRKGHPNMTIRDFMDYVNETLLPQLQSEDTFPKSVSMTTARKFLHDLGFQRTDTTRKGVYRDGHERPDVVESRTQYVCRVQELERSHLCPPLPSDVIPGEPQPCLLSDSSAPSIR